ncbi:hypothetical protein F1880_008907 [Penicillium rolfsii]|nr:hypothetical protein F1880_008907 [Penicillium rolfsii]
MATTQAVGEISVISSADLPIHIGKKQPVEYDLDQCIAAMKGNKVPPDLTSLWHRRTVIHGIRDSLQFATSPAITELCSGDDSQFHQFSRARNARPIMSNIIPDMQDSSTEPYCIWYPEPASEETDRELARQYPSMRYQVGRACAAACYTDLYKELDLLPDKSIAEEARNAAEDAEIYKIIMSAPQRWATPAFLNGNMKPRRALGQRVFPPKNLPDTTADDIDIEEDGFIGMKEKIIKVDRNAILGPGAKLGPGNSEYLWMPLPPDLPVFDKRLPTQMAAWEGKLLSEGNERECREIRTAINARKIMINDISDLEDDSDCLPWLIWWTVRPHENTLRELASKCPSMRHQIAITAILCDYKSLFRSLKPPPRESFFEAAKQSRNPFYLKYLEEFVRERSIGSRDISEFSPCDTTVEASLQPDLEPRDPSAHSSIQYSDMAVPWGQHPRDEWGSPGIYGGQPADLGVVERYMWLSFETAQKIEDESSGIYNGSADTGYLYIEDDDSDNELWLKLSRPLKHMTSFEMKDWEDEYQVY